MPGPPCGWAAPTALACEEQKQAPHARRPPGFQTRARCWCGTPAGSGAAPPPLPLGRPWAEGPEAHPEGAPRPRPQLQQLPLELGLLEQVEVVSLALLGAAEVPVEPRHAAPRRRQRPRAARAQPGLQVREIRFVRSVGVGGRKQDRRSLHVGVFYALPWS